jgi:hypothetical protein
MQILKKKTTKIWLLDDLNKLQGRYALIIRYWNRLILLIIFNVKETEKELNVKTVNAVKALGTMKQS